MKGIFPGGYWQCLEDEEIEKRTSSVGNHISLELHNLESNALVNHA